MSLRQIAMSFDNLLKETFEDASLPQDVWFCRMEELVKNNLPRRYSDHKPYDIVLTYVKWKYITQD